MHALNNKCYSFPPAERWSRLAAVCAGKKNVPEKKKRSLLFGRNERAGIRSSLLYCFKEERRQEVGDLKEVFPISSYMCSD